MKKGIEWNSRKMHQTDLNLVQNQTFSMTEYKGIKSQNKSKMQCDVIKEKWDLVSTKKEQNFKSPKKCNTIP